MIAALSWLITSKAGRMIAVTLLACLAAWAAYRMARSSGAAAEKARQTKANLEALKTRITVDDELSKMSPSDIRRELSLWMRADDA